MEHRRLFISNLATEQLAFALVMDVSVDTPADPFWQKHSESTSSQSSFSMFLISFWITGLPSHRTADYFLFVLQYHKQRLKNWSIPFPVLFFW
jgi:hypothetical protein